MSERGALWLAVLVMAALLIFLYSVRVSVARDDGRYANSPLKGWFDSLKSGKGPCCSDADGSVVRDADWESVNDASKPDVHYRVRIDGDWLDVPDDAVLTVPNLFGQTLVWPFRGYLGVTIRCFMPGPLT